MKCQKTEHNERPEGRYRETSLTGWRCLSIISRELFLYEEILDIIIQPGISPIVPSYCTYGFTDFLQISYCVSFFNICFVENYICYPKCFVFYVFVSGILLTFLKHNAFFFFVCFFFLVVVILKMFLHGGICWCFSHFRATIVKHYELLLRMNCARQTKISLAVTVNPFIHLTVKQVFYFGSTSNIFIWEIVLFYVYILSYVISIISQK